jgi:hypothetical protein
MLDRRIPGLPRRPQKAALTIAPPRDVGRARGAGGQLALTDQPRAPGPLRSPRINLVRTKLTGVTLFYVRPDGNNSNSGLVDTPARCLADAAGRRDCVA